MSTDNVKNKHWYPIKLVFSQNLGEDLCQNHKISGRDEMGCAIDFIRL